MLLQLKDCVLNGVAKNSTFAISKMFSTKLKFAAARLLAGFDKKFKNSNLELSYDGKTKYEIKNMIDSESYACCICSFPSQINLTNMIDIRNTKRFSYCDFYIMQEHNSLWNVLTEEKLAKTKNKKILIFILFYLLNFWKLSLICKTRGIIMIWSMN